MGSTLRRQELSLADTLKSKPTQFSFEMAAYVLEHGSMVSFGKETNITHAPFKTKSINSFHLRATEIEKISEDNGVSTIHIERLTLAGLNAPLPTPYAELIFTRSLEQDMAIAAFLNMFNSRLLGISYQISRRRYLTLQDHRKNCMLVRSIATFFGENPSAMNRKLSRLAYLFWTKEKSAAGLEAIITSYFSLETRVKQFQPFWDRRTNVIPLGASLSPKPLPGKSKCELQLGKNSILGSRIPPSSFGIGIEISHKNYEYLCKFLTNNKNLDQLKLFIKKYVGDFFICKLSIVPQFVPPLRLGSAQLGRTAWFPSGKKLDDASIFI
ncbi:MAG: type VI secretion system baseplate subunit TssG [Holosporaceae bacterium]|jgi:type VI secretion system protein ImpH|nr:type VI secretion system baseplate subunit TssG [Holosporaceae bacterium]